MASVDPLLTLRTAIASSNLPTLTTSASPDDALNHETDDLALATHLHFSVGSRSLPLSTATRFVSNNAPVDLRSIFFAWQKKDVAIPEYIADAQELNKKLETISDGSDKVRNLVFVERLDLITWLEGASEESEYITPLAGVPDDGAAGAPDGKATTAAADIASGAAGGVGVAPSAGASGQTATTAGGVGGVAGRQMKIIDARLQEIYNGERKMGDRNTVLRGIKPTDFSHVRKTAEAFLGRHRRPPPSSSTSRPGGQTTASHRPASSTTSARAHSASTMNLAPQKPLTSSSRQRQDPIILCSPSASSLLRLSNIKSFLDTGLFVPPDHPTLASHTSTNMVQITRQMRSLDSNNIQSSSGRGTRFVIVDTPELFKPDYWSRVVAVFTTGQTWQFKSYKWREPVELFRHALGVYVGWEGEPVPKEVRGWGRGVVSFSVQRWDERVHAKAIGEGGEGAGMAVRWKDREVVEGVWASVEGSMRGRGWGVGGGTAK
ncbi:MAG: hypothetical protein Q9160_004305 [Pyrenula sp. 1 TL-2023]